MKNHWANAISAEAPINKVTNSQKAALGIAGLTALGIGLFILIAPRPFYASYGIALTSEPSMLSELRALAANLSVLGIIMLVGIVRVAWINVSTAVALVVFLAFPAGRTLSLIVDGMPSNSMLAALAIEIAIGALCVAAFWRRPGQNISGHAMPGFQD